MLGYFIRVGITAAIALLLSACSSKSMYATAMQSQKSKCIREATSESQILQCEREADAQPSFEDYEKQRKEVIKGGQ